MLVMAMCLPLFTVALAASVPSAPEDFTALAGKGQVTLVWFEPEDDGGEPITGYQVSIDGGATWTDVGLATTYTYSGLTGGKTYVFMVRAVNDAGYGDEAIANAKPKDGGSSNDPGNQQGQGQGTGGGLGQQFEQQDPPQPPPDTPEKPQDKPQDEPPPQVEPPQPEDYLPVEVDPAEVAEKPLKPKRAQIKKQVGTYTVVASGKLTRIYDAYVRLTFILDFKATKVSGNMYGNYTGTGSLYEELDSAYWQASVGSGMTNEHTGGGPLNDIKLGLYVPVGGVGGDGLGPLPPLTPAGNADSGLTPLPPINLSTQGEGKGTMYWNASDTKNLVTSEFGTGHNTPLSPQSLNFEVIIYENGNGIVKLNYRGGSLYFPARLVKRVTLVDVK